MSDLISRSELINKIRGIVPSSQDVDFIVRLIDALPTAYDVDKVVEEIKRKHCKKCRNILGAVGAEEYCKEQKCEIDELCDIVRKGGVE